MSRKRETYGSISRTIRELLEKQEQEKKRMADVMATSLLDNEAAEMLGEYSDADLRRIMQMVAADMGNYISRLEADKEAKRKAASDVSPVSTPAPAGAYGNYEQQQYNGNDGWNG